MIRLLTKATLVTFVILLISVTSFVFAEDGVVAIVNNDVITQKDLNDFINFMRIQMSAQYSEAEVQQKINNMLPDLINRLIEDRLILQAAYREEIIIEEARIKARVIQIKKKYLTEADLQNALLVRGLSLADIELKIKEQLLMVKIIDKKIKGKIEVKPQEVTDYYYVHKQDFYNPEQRQVRFLIIEDSDLGKEFQKTITKYKDLAAIAKEFSLEITDLDWVSSKQLKKEVADVVFNLEEGSFSLFLDSEENFYIFEVNTIRLAGERALFDVQESISRFLFESKMQEALVEWLEQLKSEAYIEIKHDYETG